MLKESGPPLGVAVLPGTSCPKTSPGGGGGVVLQLALALPRLRRNVECRSETAVVLLRQSTVWYWREIDGRLTTVQNSNKRALCCSKVGRCLVASIRLERKDGASDIRWSTCGTSRPRTTYKTSCACAACTTRHAGRLLGRSSCVKSSGSCTQAPHGAWIAIVYLAAVWDLCVAVLLLFILLVRPLLLRLLLRHHRCCCRCHSCSGAALWVDLQQPTKGSSSDMGTKRHDSKYHSQNDQNPWPMLLGFELPRIRTASRCV